MEGEMGGALRLDRRDGSMHGIGRCTPLLQARRCMAAAGRAPATASRCGTAAASRGVRPPKAGMVTSPTPSISTNATRSGCTARQAGERRRVESGSGAAGGRGQQLRRCGGGDAGPHLAHSAKPPRAGGLGGRWGQPEEPRSSGERGRLAGGHGWRSQLDAKGLADRLRALAARNMLLTGIPRVTACRASQVPPHWPSLLVDRQQRQHQPPAAPQQPPQPATMQVARTPATMSPAAARSGVRIAQTASRAAAARPLRACRVYAQQVRA